MCWEKELNQLSFHLAENIIQNNVHLDLSLHSDAEEGDEVHDQDRPEHRDIEHLEKGTAEGNHLNIFLSNLIVEMKESGARANNDKITR